MTYESARIWLIMVSLCMTGALAALLFIAPLFGYPLDFADSMRLAQIVFPVLTGYVASNTRFTLGADQPVEPSLAAPTPRLAITVKGPMALTAFIWMCGFVRYGWTNRPSAVVGTGSSIDELASLVCVGLVILSANTSLVVTRLFAASSAQTTKAGSM